MPILFSVGALISVLFIIAILIFTNKQPNLYKVMWTWPRAVNIDRRQSSVDHTQRPALCTT